MKRTPSTMRESSIYPLCKCQTMTPFRWEQFIAFFHWRRLVSIGFPIPYRNVTTHFSFKVALQLSLTNNSPIQWPIFTIVYIFSRYVVDWIVCVGSIHSILGNQTNLSIKSKLSDEMVRSEVAIEPRMGETKLLNLFLMWKNVTFWSENLSAINQIHWSVFGLEMHF